MFGFVDHKPFSFLKRRKSMLYKFDLSLRRHNYRPSSDLAGAVANAFDRNELSLREDLLWPTFWPYRMSRLAAWRRRTTLFPLRQIRRACRDGTYYRSRAQRLWDARSFRWHHLDRLLPTDSAGNTLRTLTYAYNKTIEHVNSLVEALVTGELLDEWNT